VSAVFTVYGKELRHYFVSPIGYILIALYWCASGFFFSFGTVFISAIDMVNAFHNISLLLLLMMPFISMRLFAEERTTNTLELLFALPIGIPSIVLGKYLALMTILFLMLAGSTSAVAVLLAFGEPDLGPIIGGYLGVLFIGSAFAAIGILASSLVSNQILAAALAWFVLIGFWFIDYLTILVPDSSLILLIRHLSFSVQYLDLIRGVLDINALAYFFAITLVALTLSASVIAMKRG
tara:strand:- start:501 stop:1211 length:711 start_codon:yes stop_codon:yes gene_type:complete